MQGIHVKCCVPFAKEMTVEERPMGKERLNRRVKVIRKDNEKSLYSYKEIVRPRSKYLSQWEHSF